jgi:hypothetical protein
LPRGDFERSFLFSDIRADSLSNSISSRQGAAVAFQMNRSVQSGETISFRLVRGVAPAGTETDTLLNKARPLFGYDWQQDIDRNEQLYSSIPPVETDDPEKRMMYWNAYTLMRQVFYPPANMTDYNYYVFSREPTWGWGHGGQVFHESLAMHAYVFMDEMSAQNSQRVYMERQKDNGYIDYRSGGYLSEQIPDEDGELTTSAPWFNWENWTLYRETGDQQFLEDAYRSGKKFYNFWLENRNDDNDGLMEWGGVAFLEAVRDGQVAAWQVGAPENFESISLNTMLVKEAKSLAKMAKELGDTAEAQMWGRRADTLTKRINNTFWDEETDFYYMVDKDDHDFTYNETDDLKRQEIIGFLPLWAGVATQQQAEKLVQTLTNENKFWREHGIPSLSAQDPYYNHAGYWNGPVWVQWEYLIFRGLINYGYDELARELADKVFNKVIFHLKRDHTFWEMYSPDTDWAGHHQAYIWTGIVARMMLDLQREVTSIDRDPPSKGDELPDQVQLHPNAPNPFNPTTTISYSLPSSQTVNLSIYNVLGQEVATLINGEKQSAGEHRLTFNARNLSSGVYVYRLQTRQGNLSRKMMIMK